MRRILTITIDVEPDCRFDWKYSNPLRFDGVSEGIANRLHPLFAKYNVQPTYLINNVVLEDEQSCKVLNQLPGEYELGTHLHPEFIEPDKKFYDYAGKKAEANCCFLPPETEFAKLANITALFEQRFGRPPTSFRAGRFSAGANTISSLARLNYLVDTSVTPHVNWNDRSRERPVDFTAAYEQPYFVKNNSITECDPNGRILEVPVTIGVKKTNLLPELKTSFFGVRRPYRKTRPYWLRPVFSSFSEFVSLTESATAKHGREEPLILNMMFHNVEVMPGLSPYTSTEADCKRYLQQLEDYFIYCRSNDIESLTLQKVHGLYRA
jgi:hypothetical protein